MPLPPSNQRQPSIFAEPATAPERPHRRRGLTSTLILIGLLALAGIILLHRRDITDWYLLRGYQAPAAIADLASQDTMNDHTRKVLYVNHAALQSKRDFTRSCPNNGGEQTIILGCYHPDQRGIYLLHVDDSRLSGVEQVTAAHETLHAMYDRLSNGQKRTVNAMLLDYYNNDLHDARLRKTIDAYKQSEPHDVVNEMHSIFGTEVLDLPSGLETYYAQYFTNRRVIAEAAQRYQSEFTSRQAIVAQDDSRLAALKTQIDAGESSLKSQQQQIENRRTALEGQRQAGNTAAYNAGVPAYNGMIDAYNSQVQAVRGMIGQYNQLVSERNAVAVEVDQLVNDLHTGSVSQIQN